MQRLLNAFLLLLASAADRELAHMVEFLKAENQVLRGKLPRRITVTPQERQRLLRLGLPLGPALKDLLTIVSPRTFARWARGETRQRPVPGQARPVRAGRPHTAAEVRQLVLRLAQETDWGYTRILGELQKLGVRVSRSTVVNLLKAEGLEPGPRRGQDSWAAFLQRHAATLWACDFFTKKAWTPSGLVDVFVLFFLHLGSRRVYVAGVTAHPNRLWVAQQARNLMMHVADQPERPTVLLRDRDGKFGPEFDAVFQAEGAAVRAVGPRAPNLNAHAERWVLSVKRECLDHFVVFGEEHLRYLVTEYAGYYNRQRPHQGVGNQTLSAEGPGQGVGQVPGAVACTERLGGLLRHYHRLPAA